MMSEDKITEIALEAGLLNYIDNETPRRYFINGHAEQEEVEKFAELIIRECMEVGNLALTDEYGNFFVPSELIAKHFGVNDE
jgi:hypothetical protein